MTADTSEEPRRSRRPDDGTAAERRPPVRQDRGERRARPQTHRGTGLSAAAAARRAAEAVAELTGHDVETVISIERNDDGWKVGVEVVETRRIPDSADILAGYEVFVDCEGELVSYRRTHRYARGQLHGGSR